MGSVLMHQHWIPICLSVRTAPNGTGDHWAQSLECTKGNEQTLGALKFMPFKMTGDLGENGFSGGWKTGNEGGHPWSNDLPSSLEPPNGWVGTDAVEQNSLRATWDCCDGDKLTELQTEF